MDKDAYSEKVAKIIERINGLNYEFPDSEARQAADALLEGVVAALENYLDLIEGDDSEQDYE